MLVRAASVATRAHLARGQPKPALARFVFCPALQYSSAEPFCQFKTRKRVPGRDTQLLAKCPSMPAQPEAQRTHFLFGANHDILDDVPITDRFTRLQALLSQWLRMENVVALVGSGASKSHEGPLMPELESFVLEELQLLAPMCGFETCQPILAARQTDRAVPESIGFEQWLSFLSTALYTLTAKDSPVSSISLCTNEVESIVISKGQLARLMHAAGHLVLLRCSLALPNITEINTSTGHHAFVAKLVARDPSLGRVHVFTTNYDTLLEQAMDDLGIRFSDGFVGNVRKRFDPSAFTLDLYYPGDVAEGRVRRFDKFLHLYKTHGSVNWRRTQAGAVVQSSYEPYSWADWNRLRVETKAKAINEDFTAQKASVAILPTENKFVQTLGLPYAHLFRALHQRLQEPQTFLLVLGYSFGDEHINRIIEDAMTNPNLVMLVLNPACDKRLKARLAVYQQTGDRAFFLCGNSEELASAGHGTFDDFAINILPNVKWIEDFVRLRRTEAEVRQTSPSGLEAGEAAHDE